MAPQGFISHSSLHSVLSPRFSHLLSGFHLPPPPHMLLTSKSLFHIETFPKISFHISTRPSTCWKCFPEYPTQNSVCLYCSVSCISAFGWCKLIVHWFSFYNVNEIQILSLTPDMYGILPPYLPPLAEFRPLSSTDVTNSFTEVFRRVTREACWICRFLSPVPQILKQYVGAELNFSGSCQVPGYLIKTSQN